MRFADTDPLNRNRFPLDDWALIERQFDPLNQGHAETLFAVGNGYLGMRGNVEEGRDGSAHGTFVNGFHETWPIRHAEDAFGFARVGQTIVNVPDAKIIRLYVDDEPLVITEAEILSYERRLDFRAGSLDRSLEWRTPAGKRVRIASRRMTSFVDRHLAVMDYIVEMIDADASITITSHILNRQDGRDEYRARSGSASSGFDPRKAETFTERVLQPQISAYDRARYLLCYEATNSGMTIAVAADHAIVTDNPFIESGTIGDDAAKHVYRIQASAAAPIRITKFVSYHTADAVPARELADRAERTLDRASALGAAELFRQQAEWLEDFWVRSDVEVAGQPELQQAIRWNLFQLAQASVRTDGGGVAAKGVSGSGYGGHYFWDSEIYVMPFLTYTAPNVARNALRFRQKMLPAARNRALEMNQRGALFPWRTINGLESSAYYAAGTAQYHIDADVSYALMQYVAATGDDEFLANGAIDILVETARMWEDLGFWHHNGDDVFHIHGVTGPDEYTTVVNDNLYTNVMARANLEMAATAVEQLQERRPHDYEMLVERLDLADTETESWRRAANRMHIPFNESLGVHPQDAAFLDKERWDLQNTPSDHRPLLLQYHPLVIYRFQVLKQADVVLALFLQGDRFTLEEKLSNFRYYDPLTTGDSTLSAVVQSIIAAEVGYSELALRYFRSALFVDLADLHHNAADGVHVASTGGVWGALVSGFGGFRDHGGRYTFDPRLPHDWAALTFRLTLQGARVRITVEPDQIRLQLESGSHLTLQVRGVPVDLQAGAEVFVRLDGQGSRCEGVPAMSEFANVTRPDGSDLSASFPEPVG